EASTDRPPSNGGGPPRFFGGIFSRFPPQMDFLVPPPPPHTPGFFPPDKPNGGGGGSQPPPEKSPQKHLPGKHYRRSTEHQWGARIGPDRSWNPVVGHSRYDHEHRGQHDPGRADEQWQWRQCH